jgi:lipoprotein-releasing system permease protein
MNIASFIAGRISFNKQRTFSRFIIRLATVATTLSVASMIITLAFVNGFQQTVSNKVFSFWGHLRVQQYESAKAIVAEETPLKKNDSVTNIIRNTKGVQQVQAFATKSAVLENNKEIEGILFKGVEQNYDFKNFKSFIVEGKWLDFTDSLYSKDVVIPKPIAQQLKIKLHDTVRVFFISAQEGKSNVRKMHVAGIYKTGIEEYDKLFALGDIRLLRRINGWEDEQIGGYEIFLNDYSQMDTLNKQLYSALPQGWVSRTMKELYPNIFDWLNIQNVNRDVIFIVMAIVAIINLITCLLILVLERTRMVGILKAVGSTDWTIQKIFLFNAGFIAGVGIFFGLIVGLGLCWLQQATGFIKLDESAYYVSTAPVTIIWWQVVVVCVGTLVVCFVSLVLPSLIVRTIRPVKAIQFR